MATIFLGSLPILIVLGLGVAVAIIRGGKGKV